MIPSVRHLAKKLAINPNTVARAYRQLQDTEIVESIRGTGLQVAQNALKICKTDRAKIIKGQFSNVVSEARRSHLSDDDIKKAFNEALTRKRNEK